MFVINVVVKVMFTIKVVWLQRCLMFVINVVVKAMLTIKAVWLGKGMPKPVPLRCAISCPGYFGAQFSVSFQN